jgi:GT2 family glycosyltransferase
VRARAGGAPTSVPAMPKRSADTRRLNSGAARLRFAPPHKPAVSVVIPARDAAATLERTLASLEHQDLDAPFETIVVDNGSRDDTHVIAERAALPVHLIRLARGEGAGVARNAGAAVARADAIAFTDADCFPAPGWLREGLAALADADLVQGRVEADPGTPPAPFDHTLWITGPSPLYETANLLIRSRVFENVGGFVDWQAASGRPFGEDVWLGWRARRAGARIAFAERALVHHAIFRRSGWAYVAERVRLRWFPALVSRVPELRREFLLAGLFLTPRSARFDLALAGALAAALTRSKLPLAASVPYALEIAKLAAAQRRRAPLVGAVEVAADAVGFAALLAGSVRSGSPVL